MTPGTKKFGLRISGVVENLRANFDRELAQSETSYQLHDCVAKRNVERSVKRGRGDAGV